MTIVDLDDFCQVNHDLDLLMHIKRKNPEFRATLFTIPGRSSMEFIDDVRKNCAGWLELVPHGWNHPTPRECQHWTYAQCVTYLDAIEPMGLVRGFKAPGWQISDPMYDALLRRGYWVADQEYNNSRRPKALKTYLLRPESIHGHIGHMGGHNANAMEYILPQLLAARDCRFVSEVVNEVVV